MATHLLSIKHYIIIYWWLITLREYKVALFYYYEKHMGMVDLFAFRRAKNSTKKDFLLLKDEITELVRKEQEITEEELNNAYKIYGESHNTFLSDGLISTIPMEHSFESFSVEYKNKKRLYKKYNPKKWK